MEINRPMLTPINKSVQRITTMVIANGKNCFHFNFHISLYNFGFVKLNPVTNKIAAREAKGILLRKEGIRTTASKRKSPCVNAESFVLPPASAFAAPLTTTDVIGMAPNKPQAIFPIPCAINSLFTGVIR